MKTTTNPKKSLICHCERPAGARQSLPTLLNEIATTWLMPSLAMTKKKDCHCDPFCHFERSEKSIDLSSLPLVEMTKKRGCRDDKRKDIKTTVLVAMTKKKDCHCKPRAKQSLFSQFLYRPISLLTLLTPSLY